MSTHWAQKASRANGQWLKKIILDQPSDELSLIRLQAFAWLQRGIARERLLIYLESLELEGQIEIDYENKVVRKGVNLLISQERKEKLGSLD